jgi:hypothetical protein
MLSGLPVFNTDDVDGLSLYGVTTLAESDRAVQRATEALVIQVVTRDIRFDIVEGAYLESGDHSPQDRIS